MMPAMASVPSRGFRLIFETMVVRIPETDDYNVHMSFYLCPSSRGAMAGGTVRRAVVTVK